MSQRSRACLYLFLLSGIGLALIGCTNAHYRHSADKEAAKVIAQKAPAVPNMDPKFTIETNGPIFLDDLAVNNTAEESFGPDEKDLEKGASVLSLEKALELAVKYSRNYQTRKETLYLKALDLTLARHRYTPIFSGGVKGVRTTTHVDPQDLDPPHIASGIDYITEKHDVNVNGNAGVDMLLYSGGKITASFFSDFTRFIMGDPSLTKSSSMAATLTQPLLKGAGYKIAVENLTQAERNLLYALRDFTRYRKEFSVSIASDYYRVLQNRDSVRNSWRGLQNFRDNVRRETAFTEQGRRAQAALDQLKQAELSTETKWVQDVRSYKQSLDAFKLALGLPLSANIVLDNRELDELKIVHPTLTTSDAIVVAIASRLDLQNQKERLDDSNRQVDIAANGLLPQADLISGVTVPSRSANDMRPDFQHYSWYAGLDVDLPFDRKSQRNSYRAALIARASAVRDYDLVVDQVRQGVTEDWRTLDQARRNYEISEIGVTLNERRVEEQVLRAELGLGVIRDLVDAQNDLIISKNNRTAALVGHTLARLSFWRDMGILMIKDNGKWEEINNAGKN